MVFAGSQQLSRTGLREHKAFGEIGQRGAQSRTEVQRRWQSIATHAKRIFIDGAGKPKSSRQRTHIFYTKSDTPGLGRRDGRT